MQQYHGRKRQKELKLKQEIHAEIAGRRKTDAGVYGMAICELKDFFFSVLKRNFPK